MLGGHPATHTYMSVPLAHADRLDQSRMGRRQCYSPAAGKGGNVEGVEYWSYLSSELGKRTVNFTPE